MTTDRRGLNWPILLLAAGWLALCVWLFGCQTAATALVLPASSTNATQGAWSDLSTATCQGQYQSRMTHVEMEFFCYGQDGRPTPGMFGTEQWFMTRTVSHRVHRLVPVWRGREWPQLVDTETTRDETHWYKRDGGKWIQVEGVTP